MKALSLTLAALRWFVTEPFNLAATIFTVTASPLIALCAYTDNSDARQYLVWPLKYLTTPDSGRRGYAVDEWWKGGYYRNAWAWSAKWTDFDFLNSAWKRYVARVMWLIRNPAYGVAWDLLGYKKLDCYSQIDYVVHGVQGQGFYWRWITGYRASGIFRWAFSFNLEWHYSDSRWLRLWVGHKLGDDKPVAMLADHFNPVRPA